MKNIILIFFLLPVSLFAQFYLHQTESSVRVNVSYTINDHIDRNGYKMLYWRDSENYNRTVLYFGKVSQTVCVVDIMPQKGHVGDWVAYFDKNFTKVSDRQWTSSSNPSLIIKQIYEQNILDNNDSDYYFLITDDRGHSEYGQN